jgi:hypothetical protein
MRHLEGHLGDTAGTVNYGPQGKLAGGTAGILSRMKREHFGVPPHSEDKDFVPVFGGSRKVELGLHDLSGSLLDPGREISTQLYSQECKDGQSVIFMPLGAPEDQRAFHLLNAWGKDEQVKKVSTALYDRVRKIRSTMTRIKYASESDAGVNYRWINYNDHGAAPKFRYMPSLKARMFDAKATEEASKPGKYATGAIRPPAKYPGRTKLVDMTAERLEELRSAGLNYKSILTKRFKYNEIIIAYREHGEGGANRNKNFPLYGVFSKSEKKWNLYKINSDGAQGDFVKSVNDKS